MKIYCLLLLFIWSGLFSETPPELKGLWPDKIQTGEKHKLYLFYNNKDTRSEGVHGVLYREGLEVVDGSIAVTSFGKLEYFGDYKSRKMPWEKTGWLPVGMKKQYSMPHDIFEDYFNSDYLQLNENFQVDNDTRDIAYLKEHITLSKHESSLHDLYVYIVEYDSMVHFQIIVAGRSHGWRKKLKVVSYLEDEISSIIVPNTSKYLSYKIKEVAHSVLLDYEVSSFTINKKSLSNVSLLLEETGSVRRVKWHERIINVYDQWNKLRNGGAKVE